MLCKFCFSPLEVFKLYFVVFFALGIKDRRLGGQRGGGHVLLTCCCRLSFLRRPWVVRLQNRGRLPKLQVRIRSPNRPKSHFRGFNFQNFLQEYHAELFRKLAPSAIDNSPPLNLYYAKSGNSVETLTKQPIGTIIKILDL